MAAANPGGGKTAVGAIRNFMSSETTAGEVRNRRKDSLSTTATGPVRCVVPWGLLRGTKFDRPRNVRIEKVNVWR